MKALRLAFVLLATVCLACCAARAASLPRPFSIKDPVERLRATLACAKDDPVSAGCVFSAASGLEFGPDGPDLEEAAAELYASTNLQSGNTGKQPDKNVYAGKYRPFISEWLSNTGVTGYSTTAWYLITNPADVSAFRIGFLNGNRKPTVQQGTPAFSTLGKQFRIYYDYGVGQGEKRAWVKSTGVAAVT